MFKNMLKKVNNKKSGFSIIEISIVLMIIGMLTAAAFAGYKYYKNAQVKTTQATMRSLDLALESYRNEFGDYPEELEDLVNKSQEKLANEKDLRDAWGQDFDYVKNPKGSNKGYTLSTYNPVADKEMYSEGSSK